MTAYYMQAANLWSELMPLDAGKISVSGVYDDGIVSDGDL
eukprot:CAMPEP_0177790932 /NCGR_PEP_ID=MMETSP0491_2-20121128/23639_1 /TAXON_ID=63592 /ORGANISM="Tetraselmis chuii, Strain PLY429" /LENGTH=39 /DNA_ID= /DNA_START= /DNA_END= /DNA_ORIENTATION=